MLTYEEQQQNISTLRQLFRKPLINSLSFLNARELQNLEKVSEIWFKNLNSVANKIKNTKSSTVLMRLKDAIKLEIVKLDKPETNLAEKVLPEDGLNIYLYWSCEIKKDEKLTSSGVKIEFK